MSKQPKKTFRKLTKEEKKAVWAKDTESNAGAGWDARGSGEAPRRFIPNRERDTTLEIDKEFK